MELNIREVARKVQYTAHDRVVWNGAEERLSPVLGVDSPGAAPHVGPLGQRIYQRFYLNPGLVRGGYASADDRNLRDIFAREIAQRIPYERVWSYGWRRDEAAEGSEDLVTIVRRDGTRTRVSPTQFDAVLERAELNNTISTSQPGWVYVLGRDQAEDKWGRIVRVYWNLSAAGVMALAYHTSREFEQSGLPFRLKVIEDPDQCWRADAGVMYLDANRWPEYARRIRSIYSNVEPWLRAQTPLFARRVARGLALAEDPGNGQSYGIHRSMLLAEALYHAFESGATDEGARADSVVEFLVSARYAPHRFHLNPGTLEDFILPNFPKSSSLILV